MIGKLKRVSVFGGRKIKKNIYDDTVLIGKMLAEEGCLVFCGGGKGVMEAVSVGVSSMNGTVIGVLKGENTIESNDYLTIPFCTGIGIARNALLAYNCDVAIAISGKYGTLSEIAYALQLQKTVIGYKTWGSVKPVIQAKSPFEVIELLKIELNNVDTIS